MTDNRIIGLAKRSVTEYFNGNNEHKITDYDTYIILFDQILGNCKMIIGVTGYNKKYLVTYSAYSNEIYMEEYNMTGDKIISLCVEVEF